MEYYCYKVLFFLIKLYVDRYIYVSHSQQTYHGVDSFHHLQHLLLVNGSTVINIIPGQWSGHITNITICLISQPKSLTMSTHYQLLLGLVLVEKDLLTNEI